MLERRLPLNYTAKQAMAMLPCGKTKLYQLVHAGHLKVAKLGRRTLIDAESLRQFHRELHAGSAKREAGQ
jgi:excisionase family DNA binding protein